MERFWAVGVLLLAGVILVEACNYCVSKEQCQKEMSIPYFFCSTTQVCCEVLRSNSPDTDAGYGGKGSEKEIKNVPITPFPGSERPPPPAVTQVQGLSNSCGLGVRKNVTDTQSKPGQFPWVVAVFNRSDQYYAGGTLISAGVVLTAAHRVSHLGPEQIYVRAGLWNLESTTKPFLSEARDVDRIESHELFDYESAANNLALLFLNTPFELEDHIKTIRLPSSNKAIEGQFCTLAGWAWPSRIRTQDQGIMKKMGLSILDRNTCQNQLRRAVDMGNDFTLPQSLICTGGLPDRQVSLAGGSALFCSIDEKNPDIYEQVGIVSWIKDCGQDCVIETYTDVFMFREWIRSRIGMHSCINNI
ncbi:phenoloxidase-activating factor 2-like [Drosophila subpulchrella]|uniref:phenoloxidase-activating factor 2-like n=1 Tax=Drosophila subpulchrella TaxID=1486046 RepID=UPI0018A1AC44|nr:phenoloxidase-activating factor 2-like [Drosophila subpulchrella]